MSFTIKFPILILIFAMVGVVAKQQAAFAHITSEATTMEE